MNKLVVIGAMLLSILSLSPVPAQADWVQWGDDWKYIDDDTGGYTKNKWILDNGDWYYIGNDEFMLKNDWLRGDDGKGIAWFDADGKFADMSCETEQFGPGFELNQYLSDESEGDKVSLNMDYLVELTDGERKLFDYIMENYKIEYLTADDGNYYQELFIVLTVDDLAEIAGLEAMQYNDGFWIDKYDVESTIWNINRAVMKEVREPLFYSTDWRIRGEDGKVSSVTLAINSTIVSRLTNLQHMHELLNNRLVAVLNIEDGKTSQMEAARRIYVWICSNFDYDLEYLDADLLTCLTYNKGVCWSFASLYKKMCNMCGIQCDMEGGRNYWIPGENGHVWNKNNINGIETWTDCTFGVTLRDAGSDDWMKYYQCLRSEDARSHWNFILCK